jgi:hypothetical protein
MFGVPLGWTLLLAAGLAGGQARDPLTLPPAVGTSAIVGTVTTDEAASRPIGRVIVTITSNELPAGKSAITDDNGRFALRNLPAGRFAISATKRGYLTGAFGARLPGRPGTPVAIGDGQTFETTIALAPAGVVTGLIRDEHGDPVPGLRVFAVDAGQPQAPEPISVARGPLGSGVDTDDRGIYRIFDLSPGEYLIVATSVANITGNVARPSAMEVDRILAQLQERESRRGVSMTPTRPIDEVSGASALAVTFYPGTAVMDAAVPVSLSRGEVRDGLDFVVRPVPITTVEGVVLGPSGPLSSSVQLSIVPGNTLRFFALANASPLLTQPPDAEGRFKYTTIVPGHYRIIAKTGAPAADPTSGRGGGAGGILSIITARGGPVSPDTLYAAEEFDVAGQPITGITLRLQRGSVFSGRLELDASSELAPANLAEFKVSIQPTTSGSSTVSGTIVGSTFATAQTVNVAADGTFQIAGIAPGTYRVSCTLPANARNWWLRSAVIGDRDALDTVLDVPLGVNFTNAILTLTDRHSQLSGELQTASGFPGTDYFVIVMPIEPSLRAPARRSHGRRSRRFATPAVSGRPGANGRSCHAWSG